MEACNQKSDQQTVFVLGAAASASVCPKLQLELATARTTPSTERSHQFQTCFQLCLCAICWYGNLFTTQEKGNRSSK